MLSASAIKPRPTTLILILLGLVLAVLLLAYSVLRLEGPRIRNEAVANLAAIGRLKVNQIEIWLSERRGDAEVLIASDGYIDDVQRWFDRRDPAARDRIARSDAARQRAYGYQEVELLDARTPDTLSPARRALLAAALSSGQVQFSDLYRDPSGEVWLDLVAPLIKRTPTGRNAVGAAVLRTRANTYLFPLIQTWPTASPSAETLLVRRDGDSVLFLNELRYRQGTALNLHLPLASPDLPAAIAIRGGKQVQTVEGRDHRGVPVLAAVLPVQGTDWFLLAKVDRGEVQQPLHHLLTWVSMVALVAIFIVGVTLWRLWRQQAENHQLELVAQATKKDRLLKLFYDLPFMGMAILDPVEQRWLHVNDRMCEILGYSREELLASVSWSQLSHPDDLIQEAAQLQSMLAGEIDSYQMEKRFLRKGEGDFDVALAVRCVRRGDGSVEYLVMTVRDITDRKRLEIAKTEQQRAANLLYAIASASNDVIYVKDPEGNYLFFNCEAARVMNTRPEVVLGHNDTALFPAEQAARMMAGDHEVMAGDAPVTCEEILDTADGVRTFLSTKGPLQDSDGKVIGLYGISHDITERMRAEKALATSRARLSAVIESAMDAIISVDAEHRVRLFNPAAERIFACTQAEALGQPINRFIPARFQSAHTKHMQRYAMTGVTIRSMGALGELDALRCDGSEFPIEASISHVDVDGERLLTVILRDITERKRAEQALREREEDLNRAQAVGHIGSWRLDVRRNLLVWSAENYRIFGIPEGTSLTYETFLTCVHPDDRDQVDLAWQAGLRGESYDVEHRLLVNGRVKWVRERAVMEFDPDGGLIGGFGITQDITDIKAAEQALRDSEERFHLTAEIGRSGTWDWNVHSGEIIWSRGHYEILGYREGEVPANYQSWADRVHPEDRARVEAEIRRTMQERADYMVEFRVVWPDGSVHWVSSRGRYEYDKDGNCRRMVGVMADITTLKQAELALREADQRKDEFLAMLAHELRNPLAPIRNAAHVLGRLELDDPRIRWVQDIIERQVAHLTHLVDELLDISRIVRGKITLKKTRIELADLVHQARESVQPIMTEKGHRFEVRLPEARVVLEGDLVRLVQVLQNLLNNAAKYTPNGGHIELLGRLRGGEIEIVVRDNGMGISADLLPAVFDLFRQGERTLDRSQGGLGIGLTLVQKLVEMHGGQVMAFSSGSGRGARFSVRLPLAADPVPALAPADAHQVKTPTGHALRVLVVEDDPVVAESMVVLLELDGYQVRNAATAEAALNLLTGFKPQVALIDIGLPGQDGYALAERIRQREDCADLKLVAISGYGHEDAVQRSLQAGFAQHLVKPVDPEVLGTLLAKMGSAAIAPGPDG